MVPADLSGLGEHKGSYNRLHVHADRFDVPTLLRHRCHSRAHQTFVSSVNLYHLFYVNLYAIK